MKAKIKKFYEDNKDEIVAASVAFGVTVLVGSIAAAKINAKRLDQQSVCCVNLATNREDGRRMVEVFKKNDSVQRFMFEPEPMK